MLKLVSHEGNRHLDDWGAISLMLYLYPDARVEYVHPQGVPQEYLSDPNVFLIDVGGSYEPSLNNYDHHHNKEVPCSLSLIVKHFFPNVPYSSALEAIDTIDRFGFQEAVRKGLVQIDKEVDRLRKIILLVPPGPDTGRVFLYLLRYAGSVNLDYNGFVRMLYEAMRVQGLTEEAQKRLEEEEKAFSEKVERVQYLEMEGLKVALSKESLSPHHSVFFSQTGVDVLIEKNHMKESQTSIIANTNKPTRDKAIAFADRLSQDYPLIFRHQTGFIRVLDVPAEEVINRLMNAYEFSPGI